MACLHTAASPPSRSGSAVADDLGFGLALDGAPGDVGLGWLVLGYLDDDEALEGGVRLAMAAMRQCTGGRPGSALTAAEPDNTGGKVIRPDARAACMYISVCPRGT
jgi:hypothetical protein